MARVLDLRNQKAKAKIAMMVGTTIASMIAIESIRIVLSAAATGPCGSRIFLEVSGRVERTRCGKLIAGALIKRIASGGLTEWTRESLLIGRSTTVAGLALGSIWV